MNNLENNQHSLDMLKAWKKGMIELDHSTAWKIAHDLAEAGYHPAIPFFALGLKDSDWVWREDCVTFLGFHYHPLEHEIVESMRTLLLKDPSEDVRMSAAAVLGRMSNLPDQVLFRALEFDANPYVREAAFGSILKLIGLPFKEINHEIKKLRDGPTQPTLEYIKQLVRLEGIEAAEDLLTRLD